MIFLAVLFADFLGAGLALHRFSSVANGKKLAFLLILLQEGAIYDFSVQKRKNRVYY